MSFELLDKILEESGKEAVYSTESGSTKEVQKEINEDADIFSEMDFMIEDAMRESLRSTIMESVQPADTKVDHLTILENVEFTKEQMAKFVDQTIHPILEMSGSLDDTLGDNPVSLPLPVYETALALYDCISEDVEIDASEKTWGVEKSLYEEVLGEGKKKVMKEEDEEVEDDEEGETEEVEEEIEEGKTKTKTKAKKVVKENTNISIECDDGEVVEIPRTLAEEIDNIFESYRIDTSEDQDNILHDAVIALEEIGIENLMPSMQDVTDCVVEYNKLAETTESPLLTDLLNEDTQILYEFAEKIKEKIKVLKKKLMKEKDPTLKEKIKAQISKLTAKMKTGARKVSGVMKKAGGKAWTGTKAAGIGVKKAGKYVAGKAMVGAKKGADLAKKGAVKGAGAAKKGAAKGKAGASWLAKKGVGAAKKGAAKGKAGLKFVGAAAKKHKVATAAIGAVAIAMAAAMAYKKAKGKCGGLEGDAKSKCQMGAADQAIRAAKSKMSGCKNASNPEKCKNAVNKEIAKWNAKKAKYAA